MMVSCAILYGDKFNCSHEDFSWILIYLIAKSQVKYVFFEGCEADFHTANNLFSPKISFWRPAYQAEISNI